MNAEYFHRQNQYVPPKALNTTQIRTPNSLSKKNQELYHSKRNLDNTKLKEKKHNDLSMEPSRTVDHTVSQFFLFFKINLTNISMNTKKLKKMKLGRITSDYSIKMPTSKSK